MPLKLSFKANERIWINGVQVQLDDRRSQLTFLNPQTRLLRGDMVMDEERAQMPSDDLYLAIQCYLLSPVTPGEECVQNIQRQFTRFMDTTTDEHLTAAMREELLGHLTQGNYYMILSLLRREKFC